MYAPGWLDTVNLDFLIDRGCMHNLLPKAIFESLLTKMRDREVEVMGHYCHVC